MQKWSALQCHETYCRGQLQDGWRAHMREEMIETSVMAVVVLQSTYSLRQWMV